MDVPTITIQDLHKVYTTDTGRAFIVRSNRRRYGVMIMCESCGIVCFARDDHIKIGNGRFCSPSCAKKGINNPMAGLVGELHHFYGKHHTEETKEKLSGSAPNRRGELHPNWKGGVTELSTRIRNSSNYKQWRQSIFIRDNFTCQRCSERGNIIHAHHLYRFSKIINDYNIESFNEAENCDMLWNIDNGITLCKKCHKEVHRIEGI